MKKYKKEYKTLISKHFQIAKRENSFNKFNACILPNGNVLETTSYSIRLFDEKIKEIKQIDASAIGCAVNTTTKEIYISYEKNSLDL